MKNTFCRILLISGLVSLYSFLLQAQDLPGYQKLRGNIITSSVWPTEQRDNVPVYFHGYNAFDTNRSTAFKSAGRGGWIGLNLQTACPIKKVRIYPRTDRPERVKGVIQGASNPDFLNPVNLFEIVATPETGKFTTYDIASGESFQYVRLLANNSHECNLMEIEFYTTEDAQPVEYPQLTNLPTIYIESKGQFDFVDKSEYKKSTIIVANGTTVESYPADIKGRGNSTWECMEKKSIRIKFDKKQRFLGLPANAKSWTLIANYTDKTFIRNGLAFEMSRFMDFEWTPSCTYADVVLDGCYYGTFAVCDQVQVNKDRINIDEMTPEDIAMPTITGGYHLELDAYAEQEPVHFFTNRGLPFTIKNPDDPCLPEQFDYIKNHIQQIENQLYTNPANACEQLIDLESAVKYYLHSELTGNCDAYWCIPCYKKRGDDKLYFGPVWDYDQAFLNNNRVPLKYPTLYTQHGTGQPWFKIIMSQPKAKEILKREWQKVKEQNLKQILFDYIDDCTQLLDESQVINYQRWDCLNRHVWFDEYQFETYGEYMNFLKKFIEERFAWYGIDMGILSGDYKHLLVSSKPMNEKTEWRYLISESYASDWYTEQYNDNNWQKGLAPFGTQDNLQSTYWGNPGTILIRTHFDVAQDVYDKIEELYISVFHDEDCWIYINGVEAMRLSGYNAHWEDFVLDKKYLRPGTNLIAIKCVQTVGGQLIDAGIYAKLDNETAIHAIEKGEYSYTIHDHILSISNVAQSTPVKVYTVDGRLTGQYKAFDSKVKIYLPQRGIYLVKLDNTTLKVFAK